VLFWSAYLLDKALSVRSGRAPTIQDYDITLPRGLEYGENLPDASWAVVLGQWIAYADFLGRAYEQLYSPAALARPQERRAESARQLVRTMSALFPFPPYRPRTTLGADGLNKYCDGRQAGQGAGAAGAGNAQESARHQVRRQQSLPDGHGHRQR
jgi:hypothetical protein